MTPKRQLRSAAPRGLRWVLVASATLIFATTSVHSQEPSAPSQPGQAEATVQPTIAAVVVAAPAAREPAPAQSAPLFAPSGPPHRWTPN